ncbi:hypothetical protein [Sediminibacillus massiliensis]|uniref:hypothetical protein n=1 Tax=Sediminibacillus massiliensis TaxID=1926277 RepID=UPI00098854A5|nr:hypothetical protein [Sediminibacillus massiliensis]
MKEDIQLNVPLLRKRVPNLTTAAKSVGLRPATVSNLCTGKISLGKAEVRTLVSLASLADCTVDELIIRKGGGEMIETGIKVMDFFAPIVKGGRIGLVARQGMGQLVVLTEVFYRLKKKGFRTIFLANSTDNSIADVLTETDFHTSCVYYAFEKLKEFRQEGEIILGIDRSIYLSETFHELEEKLTEDGGDAITYAIVDTSGDAVDEEMPYGPLDTLWDFDMELAVKHNFPAVHPLVSTSTILEGLEAGSRHLETQSKAKKMIRRYKELKFFVRHRGLNSLSDRDQQLYSRGEKLEAYFTQPFYVAEDFTNIKGESVPLDVTIKNVEHIMTGKVDSLESDKLRYIGELPA